MSPKSGSAGSAVAPADPDKPHDADKADPVDTAEAKARDRQTQSGKYGSTKVDPASTDDGQDAANKQEKVKTWVGIELVDHRGRPVAGEKYKITLADGSVKQGTLDNKGKAKIDNVEPGACTVTFPDRPGQAWEPA